MHHTALVDASFEVDAFDWDGLMGFEEYVAERGETLLRLAYLLTNDSHLAEDLTQTALADAYRHWRKVTAAQNPDAYVRRILVNAHLSRHRRKSTQEWPQDIDGDTRHPPETLLMRWPPETTCDAHS